MDTLESLLNAVESWRQRLALVVLPPGLRQRIDTEPVLETLFNIHRRISEGSRAPVRIALFGPTGAGKSKIFNSLTGEAISPSSFRRPCTHRPVYYLHRSRSDLLQGLRGEVRQHDREGWEDRILIDAPDFDSVEAENRALAARIYLESDTYIFVADVHKYADASTWSYLERIRTEGKACSFVLNKVSGPEAGERGGPLADFRSRLEEAFRPAALPGPLVAILDQPQGDEDILPGDDPGLEVLRGELDWFLTPGPGGGASLLVDSFRIDLDRLLSEWDRFSGPLREYRAGIERLTRQLDVAFERSAAELRADLRAEVDPALKAQVYREMLRRIEKIDVLRYPRKLLALPVTGLRSLLGKFWPQLGSGQRSLEGESDPRDAMNLASLESRLLDLSEAVRRALRAEAACPGMLDDEAHHLLRFDHKDIKERYLASSAEFRTWVEGKARDMASTLTTEHKAKFILTQVIYNSVVIGLQLKTAGTLSLTEVFSDGILSPLVAKAVGMAVSSEQVQQFEEEARQEHSRRLVEVLREGRDRLAGYISTHSKGLEEIERLSPELENLRSSRERLVESFSRSKS